MGFLKNIFSGGSGVNDVLKTGKDIIDEIFTTKEEKAAAYQKLFDSTLADKQSARSMYEKDNILQKIYALVFLVAYIALTWVMIDMVYKLSANQVTMSEFGNTFISTIWGGMSTKVSTITDFLFGSSQGSHMKDILNSKKQEEKTINN